MGRAPLASFCGGRCPMSTRRNIAGQRRRVIRPGWPTFWLILLGLALGSISPAAGTQSGAAPPSIVGPKAQSSLHLRVISILNVVHDAVDGTLATVATAPAEAQRLKSEATEAWWSGDILRAAIYCLVLLMIGADAEWLYWCYAGKGWQAIAEAAVGRETLPPARAATLGLRRAALSALGGTIFICGVLVPLSLFSWPAEVQASVVGIILAITLVRAGSIAAVLTLSPHSVRLRLVARPDMGARRLTFAFVALSATLAGALSTQSLLQGEFDAPGLANIVSAASGTVVAGLALFILHLRRPAPAPGTRRSSGRVIYPIALTTTMILLCLALHLLGAREIVSTALLWAVAFITGKIVWPIVEAYTGATETHGVAEYRPVLKSGIDSASLVSRPSQLRRFGTYRFWNCSSRPPLPVNCWYGPSTWLSSCWWRISFGCGHERLLMGSWRRSRNAPKQAVWIRVRDWPLSCRFFARSSSSCCWNSSA